MNKIYSVKVDETFEDDVYVFQSFMFDQINASIELLFERRDLFR